MKKLLFLFMFFFILENGSAQYLDLKSGTDFIMSGSANLVLTTTTIDNDGNFAYNGSPTVKFKGSDAEIKGTVPLDFYNLTLDHSTSSAAVFLESDIIINNNLTLNNGILKLQDAVLQLDDGQIIGEDNQSYVTSEEGYIELVTNLNAPDQENPGNLGLQITSVENLGATTIIRGHAEQEAENGGGQSILRYFDVSPANNTGLNATIRIYYEDYELNGVPESELEPWQSTDNGNSWELVEGSLLNTSNNWVQLSGVDAFYRWTLASANTAPLPVELSFFQGKVTAESNLLEWETLSEENVDHFAVQKLSGTEWRNIAMVESAHFSLTPQFYNFEDFDFLPEEYYRLKIIDVDGQFEYSEIIHLQRIERQNIELNVFPNPVQKELQIENADAFDNLQLLDASGQLIYQFPKPFRLLNVNDLSEGIYFLKAQKDQEFYIQKIIKQ